MENSPRYPWQQAIIEAFLASGDELPVKINVAEKAIAARLTDTQEPDAEEHVALNDALRALQILINELRPHRQPLRLQDKNTA